MPRDKQTCERHWPGVSACAAEAEVFDKVEVAPPEETWPGLSDQAKGVENAIPSPSQSPQECVG